MPAAEDAIINKLLRAKIAECDKARDDGRDIIVVQGDDRRDGSYIHQWRETHGTQALLDEIRALIPPTV